MFHHWQLVTISLFYIGLLFVIAFIGDKYRHKIYGNIKAIIYALTLGVYCTSWSFLGTTAQASTNVFSHLPIYLGPILLFIFAWPFIKRIIRVSLKLNLTSIADLLAARFGKSHNLAILVTLVALIGTLPYMALQLKAIVYSFQLLEIDSNFSSWQLGFTAALVLAGFTMVFGIRNIDVNECHPGVMLAIAFESIVKILAFIVVGVFVCFVLFESPVDIWQQANIDLSEQLSMPNISSLVGMLIIVMAAFLSLPRQFQVMVVEARDEQDSKYSRKVFPLYILVFALLAIPLGLAGEVIFKGEVAADSYVLLLPGLGQQYWITLLTFLGTISAASSMMIISAIALSTMLSNEIVFPLLFKSSSREHTNYERFRFKLLTIRKTLVLIIILLGYGVFLLVSPEKLSSLGEIAFGAIAQLTPALIAAFYWRHASLTGVYSGIATGFSLWCLLNFLPNLGLYAQPLSDISLSVNTSSTLISLGCNIIVMWAISLMSRQSVHERVQATFFSEENNDLGHVPQKKQKIERSELQLLLTNFVGKDRAKQSFLEFDVNAQKNNFDDTVYHLKLIQHSEATLASVMGSSSAKLVIKSAMQGRNINLTELAQLVEETSHQHQQFNQNILSSAIENASEGISIIDNQLNLVAWNKKYLQLFNYPKNMIYVGSPIEDLIRFNAQQGFCGDGDIEQEVEKRLNHLRIGTPHASEKKHITGQVIRIEGNPLPDGGFVMIFRDITTFKQAERVLKEENLDLESLIAKRTKKLELVNDELALARQKAEQANLKKSQYLKACSHDLMQPLEAARLFTSALADENKLSDKQRRQVNNIDQALKVANDLLFNLSEIARIEGGNIKANIEVFCLDDIFHQLEQEFSAAADEHQVEFKVFSSQCWVKTDKHLLRRILQNLLTNAFRYASPGKVLLTVKLIDDKLNIQVVDNGPGIPVEQQKLVFEQFTQLHTGNSQTAKGLGLGLSITQSLAQIMNCSLDLKSEPNLGCNFSISVPKAEPQTVSTPIAAPKVGLQGVSVLCIDNEPQVLEGMVQLLTAWQCNVYSARTIDEATEVFHRQGNNIEIILADYQLDNDESGLQLIAQIRQLAQRQIPAILITATTEHNIADKTQKAQVGYMRKMVKPAALRAMMSAMLTESLHDNYSPK